MSSTLEDVLEAFLAGAKEGASRAMHVEEDALYSRGWWPIVLRLSDDAFLVRRDVREPATARHIAAARRVLRARALRLVEREPLLAEAVTYQALSLAAGRWDLWGRDAHSARAALAARAAAESRLEAGSGVPGTAEDRRRELARGLELAQRTLRRRR